MIDSVIAYTLYVAEFVHNNGYFLFSSLIFYLLVISFSYPIPEEESLLKPYIKSLSIHIGIFASLIGLLLGL